MCKHTHINYVSRFSRAESCSTDACDICRPQTLSAFLLVLSVTAKYQSCLKLNFHTSLPSSHLNWHFSSPWEAARFPGATRKHKAKATHRNVRKGCSNHEIEEPGMDLQDVHG